MKKVQKFAQKMVDGGGAAVLYFILPVGREVSFCALFSAQTPLCPSYREAMPAQKRRVNKIGGAERMAADARVKITLRCEECKQRNYNTVKNKKNTSNRLERMKYCPFCRKHTKHVEAK